MSDFPVPVVLGIDVEPDESHIPRGERRAWRGFELMVAAARNLRPRLEDASGRPVRFNWFLRMDQQIERGYGSKAWVWENYADEIAELVQERDELGLHPHAWRWQDRSGSWTADHRDPAWIEAVMRAAFETFHQAFGRACTSHRFGDRYVSAQMVRVLRQLGVRHDLSLEPGGRGVHRHAPRRPYQPSDQDPTKARSGEAVRAEDLWMIPLTSFNPDPLLPGWKRVARRIRHPGRALHRPIGLDAACPPETFWKACAEHLDRQPVPYLAFVLRSDVATREVVMSRARAKLEALASNELGRRLHFAGPEDIVARAVPRGETCRCRPTTTGERMSSRMPRDDIPAAS